MTRLRRECEAGRIYAAAGGAPNQPLACLASDVFWSVPAEHQAQGIPWMAPQVLAPKVAWFAAKDHRALAARIGEDLAAWRAVHARRVRAPALVAVDTSQAPATLELFAGLRDLGADLDGFRLTGGDDDPILLRRTVGYAQGAVGARWLVSWFNARVAKEPPTALRFGMPHLPSRVVVNFGAFADQDPPGMTREELRAAMSAAETLLTRSGRASDGDGALDLSADEVVATVVMLSLLAAELGAPGTDARPGRPATWSPMHEDERQAAYARMART